MSDYPSPLKSIRQNCLDCCLGQATEIRLCEATSCPSSPLRFGKKVAGLNVLKTIKEHCIHCGGHEEAPRHCKIKDCKLYPFREGHNPNRKGIGNYNAKPPVLGQESRTHEPIQEQTRSLSSHCTCETPCAICTCSDRGDA